MSNRRLVILESPYAGDVAANLEYARCCLRDSLGRGESPIASHLLYTQPGVLDDNSPEERRIGVAAGLAWLPRVDASVVYTDHGISGGMRQGIEAAQLAGVPVEYRQIGAAADKRTPATCADTLGRFDKVVGSIKALGVVRATPATVAALEAVARNLAEPPP